MKPSFFTHEVLAELSPLHRILFQGLWCHADREGALEDRPRLLKTVILPYDECDIDQMLGDLADRGFIVRYETDGRRLVWIPQFDKHQKPHRREAPSELPKPTEEQRKTKSTTKDMPEHDLGHVEPGGLWLMVNGLLSLDNGVAKNPERPADQVTATGTTEPPPEAIDKPKERRKADSPLRQLPGPPSVGALVFEHWRQVMGRGASAKFTKDRRRAVEARLKEGYSTDDLKLAVDGCAVTPHNIGQNAQGTRFDDLELICRSGGHVERFIGNARAPPTPPPAKPRDITRGTARAEDYPAESHTGGLPF